MDDAQAIRIPVTLLQSVSVCNRRVGVAACVIQSSSLSLSVQLHYVEKYLLECGFSDGLFYGSRHKYAVHAPCVGNFLSI